MKCILCNSQNFDIITTKLRNNIKRNVVCCKDCKLTSLENPESDMMNYETDYRKLHSPIIGKQLSPKQFFDYEIQFQQSRIARIKKLLHSKYDVLEMYMILTHTFFIGIIITTSILLIKYI